MDLLLKYIGIITALSVGTERIVELIRSLFWKKLTSESRNAHADLSAEMKKTKEDNRKRIIQLLTILIAVGFSMIAKIDTFSILYIENENWILGCVISGLAASIGSSFWHNTGKIIEKVKEEKNILITAAESDGKSSQNG